MAFTWRDGFDQQIEYHFATLRGGWCHGGRWTRRHTVYGRMGLPTCLWHHKTFDTEPDLQGFAIPPVEQCMSDYRNTRFAKPLDPHTDAVAKAFDVLNEDVVAKLPAARTEPLVTFSHFLPRVELLPEKRYLTLPVLAKASGSSFLHERIKALQPTMHAFGHTHFGWDAKLDDGVRYVQAAGLPGRAHLEMAHAQGRRFWCGRAAAALVL